MSSIPAAAVAPQDPNRSQDIRSRRIAPFVVLLLPIIWGTTFATVQRALQDASPMAFVVARFGVGSVAILMASRAARRAMRILLRPRSQAERIFRRDSLILAITIGAGYIFQTIGLVTTTSSKSAFLTSTAVVWTPLLGIVLGRERLTIRNALAVVATAIGVFLMTHPFAQGGIVIGDVLTIGCAFAFAVYIVWIERAVPNASRFAGSDLDATMMVTAGQVVLATLIFVLFLPLLEMPRLTLTPSLISITLYTAIAATVLTGALQARYQPYVSATSAAVIYMLEPVTALLIAAVFLKERMASDDMFGSALIVLGVIIAQIQPRSVRRRVRTHLMRRGRRNESPNSV